MLGLLFNLSLGELVAIGIVALLVFGSRLPEVAAQLAVQVQRARRTLQDLRRETGIDREMWEVRRRFEEAMPRDVESPTKAFHQARLEARRKLDQRHERDAATPPGDATSSTVESEPASPEQAGLAESASPRDAERRESSDVPDALGAPDVAPKTSAADETEAGGSKAG